MSSSLVDQAEYLRKKKEEILAKKKAEKEQQQNKAKQDSKSATSLSFVNDGSFLEKFKTMQNTAKKTSSETTTKTKIKTEPVEFANDGSFLEKYKAMQQLGGALKVEPTSPKSASQLTPSPKCKTRPTFENEASGSSTDDYEIARELAEKVQREGKQAEMIARIQGRTNPRYRFLFNDKSPVARYYQTQLENLKQEPAPSTPSTPSSSITPKIEEGAPSASFLSEFEKAKALVRAKAAAMMGGGGALKPEVNVVSEEEKRRQKAIEEQKMMNEIYLKVIQQQMAAASDVTRRKNSKRKRDDDPDKPKYEYDSDEDTEGGTWEHKKRSLEMQKTAEKALDLTEMARGKHHLSDFLPPDELEKFLEKVKAVKEGREADFSDYAKYKIGEDNVGYKMLKMAGWQEGSGLGSKGEGITAPINKGKTSFDNGGLGTEKVAEVKKEDDDFEVYRKRMMLAYKFRPNPLNNPRRPYYE